MKKLEKLKEIFNNLKNYYNNNKTDILTVLGFFAVVFTISILVIELAPITNCSGIPLKRTLELFTVIFIGIAALSAFFILSMILIKLIKDKIQQNKEENEFIRTVSWFNIIFVVLVVLLTALFPLYQLYSGNILICGAIPEITMSIYLVTLAIYIVVFALCVLFVTFIEKLLVGVYNIVKRKVDKDN